MTINDVIKIRKGAVNYLDSCIINIDPQSVVLLNKNYEWKQQLAE